MKSLFINTSSFFMLVAIVENDKVLYKKEEKIVSDMATKIVPYIEECFNQVPFNIKDLDKIFIVTGPGSFTGLRIGVTAAKIIAWSGKQDLIPLSSLEVLASTKTDKKYRIPAIDARRGSVFAGVYDSDLNIIVEDKYTELNELGEYINNGNIISYDSIEGAIKPELDIIKVISNHKSDIPINPHKLIVNYLKLTEAEEKRKASE